jgi:hypothetical protein
LLLTAVAQAGKFSKNLAMKQAKNFTMNRLILKRLASAVLGEILFSRVKKKA